MDRVQKLLIIDECYQYEDGRIEQKKGAVWLDEDQDPQAALDQAHRIALENNKATTRVWFGLDDGANGWAVGMGLQP